MNLEEQLKDINAAKTSFDRLRILERLPEILRHNYLRKRKAEGQSSVIWDYGHLEKEEIHHCEHD